MLTRSESSPIFLPKIELNHLELFVSKVVRQVKAATVEGEKMRLFALSVLFAFLVSLFNVCAAQTTPKDLEDDQHSLQLQKPSLSLSLLDPSRLKMSQSYSLSFVSGDGRSQTIGLYMNSIEYQVSRPLTLTLHLGYLHQPTALFGRGRDSGLGGTFLPGFELDYRPSENFFFKINMSSYTYPYYYGIYPREFGER
jgi:hypothetical protein